LTGRLQENVEPSGVPYQAAGVDFEERLICELGGLLFDERQAVFEVIYNLPVI